MSALVVFAATFASVFALGFQSRNVNQGHYLAAAITSLFISGGHLVLYRQLPNPDALEIAGYMAGGVLGILTAMWAHDRSLSRKGKAPARRVDEHAAQHFPACIHCGLSTGAACPRLVCERWSEPTRH